MIEGFTRLEGALAAAGAPGLTLALRCDGAPVLATGVGSADPDGHVPLAAGAELLIYSITKPLIAALVLQLVEAGAVSLETALQELIPLEIATPLALRSVLRHSAGLPDYPPEYAAAVRASPERAWSRTEFRARSLADGLRYGPDQGWGYSNIGYMLLGEALEAVTGLALGALIAERLAAPLGLKGVRLIEDHAAMGGLAAGWSAALSADGRLEDVRGRYHPGWVSHGVVGASAAELCALLEALSVGDMVSPALRAALAEPYPVPVKHPLFGRPGYGLGWMVDAGAERMVIGHGGGGPGYSSGAWHRRDAAGRAWTCVVLVNSDRGELGLELAAQVLSQAMGTP